MLSGMIGTIDGFNRRCAADERTDVGAVWDIFCLLRAEAVEALLEERRLAQALRTVLEWTVPPGPEEGQVLPHYEKDMAAVTELLAGMRKTGAACIQPIDLQPAVDAEFDLVANSNGAPLFHVKVRARGEEPDGDARDAVAVSYRDPPDLTHSRWMSVTDCGVYLARGVIDPRPLYDLAHSRGWAVPEPGETSLPGRARSGSPADANDEKIQGVARRIVERLGLATPVNKASGARDRALATVVATLREAEAVSDPATSVGVSERAQYVLWCRHCDWVGLSDQASHCEACQEWLCPECGGAEWVRAVPEPDERIRQWRESGVASLEEAAERLSALLEEVGKVPCVRCGRLFVADDPRLTNHWCRLGRLRNR